MNKVLLNEIIKHILSSFSIIPSEYIDPKNQSLTDKEFLLNVNLKFEDSDVDNKVWGCQLSAESNELKVLLGDCTQDKEDPKEYCLLVQLKNAPTYVLYFIEDTLQPMLACNIEGFGWLECNTYLQATFLAGMEHLKGNNFLWSKCKDYQDQFKLMRSFIEFYNSYYEVEDEG